MCPRFLGIQEGLRKSRYKRYCSKSDFVVRTSISVLKCSNFVEVPRFPLILIQLSFLEIEVPPKYNNVHVEIEVPTSNFNLLQYLQYLEQYLGTSISVERLIMCMILVKNMKLVLQKSKQTKTRVNLNGKRVRSKNRIQFLGADLNTQCLECNSML